MLRSASFLLTINVRYITNASAKVTAMATAVVAAIVICAVWMRRAFETCMRGNIEVDQRGFNFNFLKKLSVGGRRMRIIEKRIERTPSWIVAGVAFSALSLGSLTFLNQSFSNSASGSAAPAACNAALDLEANPFGWTREEEEAIKRYTKDLTQMAQSGKLNMPFERDGEIERAVSILGKRKKASPVFVGEPGVGKTALVEGLAMRVHQLQQAGALEGLDHLGGVRIVSLNIAMLLAGTKHRGEFEERAAYVIEALKKTKGKVILFIDEIHTMVNAGKTDNGSGLGQLMKPALSGDIDTGEGIRSIGATTPREFRETFEKDGALKRRYQRVSVVEPSTETTLRILTKLLPRFEAHYGVTVSRETLVELMILSKRYLGEFYEPDRSIDLLDRACAYFVNEMAFGQIREGATELEKLSAQRMSLVIKLSKLEQRQKKLTADKEQGLLRLFDQAEADGEPFDEAGKDYFRDNFRNALEGVGDEILAAEHRLGEVDEAMEALVPSLPQPSSTAELTGEVVAQALKVSLPGVTNIIRPGKAEMEELRKLPEAMKGVVIGQDSVIDVVVPELQMSRTSIGEVEGTHTGPFLFTGPTGAGKTHFAKMIARIFLKDPEALITINGGDYINEHKVDVLSGTAPGFVGYEDAETLADQLQEKPQVVLLVDEIEKAHESLQKYLLRIIDEGVVDDARGKTASLGNVIIIFTTNVPSEVIREIQQGKTKDDMPPELAAMMPPKSKEFSPEFLGRTRVVEFDQLGDEDLIRIAQLELRDLVRSFDERFGVRVEITPEAYYFLARMSRGQSDTGEGARGMKRAIKEHFKHAISHLEIHETDGRFSRGDHVQVTSEMTRDGEKLVAHLNPEVPLSLDEARALIDAEEEAIRGIFEGLNIKLNLEGERTWHYFAQSLVNLRLGENEARARLMALMRHLIRENGLQAGDLVSIGKTTNGAGHDRLLVKVNPQDPYQLDRIRAELESEWGAVVVLGEERLGSYALFRVDEAGNRLFGEADFDQLTHPQKKQVMDEVIKAKIVSKLEDAEREDKLKKGQSSGIGIVVNTDRFGNDLTVNIQQLGPVPDDRPIQHDDARDGKAAGASGSGETGGDE